MNHNPDKSRGDKNDAQSAQSLDELYDRFAGEVFGFLLASLGNTGDAEDALQQCFLSLNRMMVKKYPDHPRAYLYEIARNQMKDHFRRHRARQQREQRWLELAPDSVEPVDRLAHEERMREIEKAMMGLPLEQRQVVALKIWQGKTFAEIAEIIGLSPNTAASRYRYGLRALRLVLRKESFA